VDSEVFADIMEKSGYQATDFPEEAEIILVNTCGFIFSAKQEAIETILEMSEYKQLGKCQKLIATGCFVKRYFDELPQELPEIDHLINLKDFSEFAELFKLGSAYTRRQLTPDHYSYLRISDGCNNHCSYCAIPSIRGKLISEPVDILVDQAKDRAASGVKELIVTAQDTTQYGAEWDGRSHLIELLERLQEIDGIKWIRLLYLHPAHLTDELIDYICASRKILHYFEVPMQHASDKLLKLMNRKVTRQRMYDIISRIRNKASGAAIRTTFIVGHPGETEADYAELLEFVNEVKFDRMGVFTYSDEEGTVSSTLPDSVDKKTAQFRQDELMALQMDISKNIMQGYFDRVIRVIIDEISIDEEFDLVGRAGFDCPEIDGVVYLYGEAHPGDIVDVKIIDTWEYDLVGKIMTDKGDYKNE
jgi:ribosomal protein S12 methylthiotransferase